MSRFEQVTSEPPLPPLEFFEQRLHAPRRNENMSTGFLENDAHRKHGGQWQGTCAVETSKLPRLSRDRPPFRFSEGSSPLIGASKHITRKGKERERKESVFLTVAEVFLACIEIKRLLTLRLTTPHSKSANLFLRSSLSALKYQYDTGNYMIQIFLTNRIYEYFLSVCICHSLESKLEKAEDASYRDPVKTAPQKQLVMNLISMYFILNLISNRQVPSILFMALGIIRWRAPFVLSQ
jgi:hypothetical protein